MSDDGIDDVSELLAFTSNELKGGLKPAEVVVSHSQIVAASRAHNVTLININSAITKLQHDMDEMRTALSKRIDNLESKVDRWGARVEDLEKRCTSYDQSFANQANINHDAITFQQKVSISINECVHEIDSLDKTVVELPGVIQIASSQIHHHTTSNNDLDVVDESDSSVRLNVIIEKHTEANLDNERRLEDHVERMNLIDEHVGEEIKRVMMWVTEQNQDDVDEMNALKEHVERIELDLDGKMSYLEVDEKIAVKVRQLVDQIKDALLSVEEDEADFKSVANALHGLFNSLSESKADKSEMTELRNQVINAQLNGGGTSQGGTLDYRGLKKILSAYSKTDAINKKLEDKAAKDFTCQRLEHSEVMIDKLLKTVDELWNVITNSTSLGVSNICIPKDDTIVNDGNPSSADGQSRTRSHTSDVLNVNKANFFKRIDYCLNRPSSAASSPMQYQGKTDRRTMMAAIDRPFTSPVARTSRLRPYRKPVVSAPKHLPAIETKALVQDNDGNLYVSNSENKTLVRDSVELSSRRMSTMSFRDGKATSH